MINNKNIKRPSNKNFGIVFFIFFLILSIFPLFYNGNVNVWLFTISLIFLILALFNSKILTPLNKFWFKFGIFIGNFISPIVMFAIFFTVVTPISLIMKIFRKDLLNLKKNNKNTYWIKSSSIKSKMKNQF